MKLSTFLITSWVLLLPMLAKSQSNKLEQWQKVYTDSLFVNTSLSEMICDSALAELNTIKMPNDEALQNENTIQKGLWNKQKGITKYFQRDFNQAIQFYQISFTNYRKAKDTLGMAKNLSNIGVCYEETDYDDSAIIYYNNAVELLQNFNEPFVFSVKNNITTLLFKKEMFEEAKTHCLNTLKNKELTDIKTRMSFFANLGSAYNSLEKYDSSFYYTQQALTIARENNFPAHQIKFLINLANQYQSLEKYEEAKSTLNEAESISQSSNYAGYDKNIFKLFGIIYYKLNDFKKSNEYYNKSLNIAKGQRDVYFIRDLHQNISLTQVKLKNYKSAYENLKKAAKINDSIQTNESIKMVAELSKKYQTLEQQNKILKLNAENEILEKDAQLKAFQIEKQENKIASRNRFIIGLIVILLVSSLSFYLFYSRKKVLASKQELELKNQKLEVESKLLQSQMNPHFIFNALNSIQRFVSESDAFNAQVYLGRFGKLMRNILEQSRKDIITLEEEMETLQLYTELEKLRFNNAFSTTISSDFFDTSDILIPPMIIQPFVENAILHGFKGINSGGELNIHFKESNENEIVCIIEDNGIGREKAALQNKSSTLKKTSLGTKVTEERLNNKHNPWRNDAIIYEDLPQGTRVKVYIYI